MTLNGEDSDRHATSSARQAVTLAPKRKILLRPELFRPPLLASPQSTTTIWAILLYVPRVYFSVLCVFVLCLIGLLFSGACRYISNQLFGDEEDAPPRDDRFWGPGLWWVFYVVVTGVVLVVLNRYAPPPWADLVIDTALLGVLPIYWAWPWTRPYFFD
jgi:hypothetical protein